MGTINKPNVVLPLASSYNPRGVQGFNRISNSVDQRKINCLYEISKNQITGGSSFDLTKRPGVTGASAGGFFGTSSQVQYLISNIPNDYAFTSFPWVYGIDGGHIIASSNVSTVTILSAGVATNIFPTFIDKTLISGAENAVLQLTNNTNLAQQTFYTTSLNGWTKISDGDFTGLSHVGKMEHMDGYAFQMDAQNRINNSDLNSISAWTAGNFITKQIQQDKPLGLAKLSNQIIAFGIETSEVFYNAGNATGSPLSGIKQLQSDVGLHHESITGTIGSGATHYYATIGKRIFFVGRQKNRFSGIGLFSYNGSVMEKVSTSYIDKILSEEYLSIYSVFSLSVAGKIGVSIQLTSPSASTQTWLMYFPEWNDWFEWNSTVFSPVNDSAYFLGISPRNNINYFSVADSWVDVATSYQFATQFTLPNNGTHLKRMGAFGVIGDTARSANSLLVEFSDDDYQSFKTAGTIDMTRENKTLYRGGAFKRRAVRLSNTNAVETRLQSFIALVK